MVDKQKNTTYLALTGELWGVCEYLWENYPRCNGTALYTKRAFVFPHTHAIWRLSTRSHDIFDAKFLKLYSIRINMDGYFTRVCARETSAGKLCNTFRKLHRLFVQKHSQHFVVSRGKDAKHECVIKLSFRTLMWTAMFQTISEHVKARIVCVVLGISSIIINHRFDKLVLTMTTSWHRTALITDSLCTGGRLIWPMIRTLDDIFIVSPSKLLNTQSSWGDLKHHDVHVSSPKYTIPETPYIYIYIIYIGVPWVSLFHMLSSCRWFERP